MGTMKRNDSLLDSLSIVRLVSSGRFGLLGIRFVTASSKYVDHSAN